MNKALGELVGRSYEVLKQADLLWHLVKFKHLTTAFIHSATAAVVAYKLALKVKEISKSSELLEFEQKKLKEHVAQLEQETGLSFEEYCYLTGLLHDYDKFSSSPKVKNVDEVADNILKFFNIPEHAWKLIKADAKSVEIAVEQFGEEVHELVVLICYIADVLAGQDSVFDLKTITVSDYVTARKLRLLESLGVRLGVLHVGSHRFITILKSGEIVKLFEERGWSPLLIYRDGVVFVGTRGSGKVSLEEIAELLISEIYEEIYGIEHVRAEIDSSIPRSFRNFVELVNKALAVELPVNQSDERSHLVLLANNLAKAVKKEVELEDALNKTLNETGKDKQSFLRSILPSTRRTIENVAKELPPEGLAGLVKEYVESVEKNDVENITRLSYLVAGWSKDVDKVAKLYRLIFGEEPPGSDFLPIIIAIIAKVFQYVESGIHGELVKLYEEGFKDFLKGEDEWKYEVYYHVSSYISGDLVEPLRKTLPKTDRYCVLCRSPIFGDEPLQMNEYGKAIGGGKGIQQVWTNDDIPLADKDDYAQSTEKYAKYTRPICTLCKYEATIIGRTLTLEKGKPIRESGGALRKKRISLPAIAIYFRPAIAPEVLSFMIQNIESGIEIVDLAEIYGKVKEGEARKRVRAQLPPQVIPNYLGAFATFSYKEVVSERDSGDILRTADLSGRRDQIYYGLLLISELAKRAGGGQFKICLSVVDLLTPPEKLIEMPVAVRFVDELNGIVAYLQEKVKDRLYREELLELYSASYYFVMRFLEGVAIRVGLWYDHTRVSEKKETATWLIRGIEDVEDLPLPIALLTPPPRGFNKTESAANESRVYRREEYRTRFADVYEIASEFEAFVSRVKNYMVGGVYV